MGLRGRLRCGMFSSTNGRRGRRDYGTHVTKEAGTNCRAQIPAGRYNDGVTKKGQLYDVLAAAARGWGYARVSDAAVHDWRKRGLLPRAVVRHAGLRGTKGENAPEAVDRLRQICRLHYDDGIRDLGVVAALLWLDGADVPPDAVRGGLVAALNGLDRAIRRRQPRRALERGELPEDRRDADLDAAATTLAREFSRPGAGWGNPVAQSELEVGLAELLAAATGRKDAAEIDPDALEPAAHLLGLDRAHSEAPPGAEPWLADAPGRALQEALAEINAPALRRLVIAAADADLLRARTIARRLLAVAPATSTMVTLGFGRGAFGFGFLGSFSAGEARLMPLFGILQRPDEADELVTALELQAAELRSFVALGQRYLDEHPELSADIGRRGLVAVLAEARDEPGDKMPAH
jgi:hypothetical protein